MICSLTCIHYAAKIGVLVNLIYFHGSPLRKSLIPIMRNQKVPMHVVIQEIFTGKLSTNEPSILTCGRMHLLHSLDPTFDELIEPCYLKKDFDAKYYTVVSSNSQIS